MFKKALLGCGGALVLLCVLIAFLKHTLLKPEVKQERTETVTRGDVDIRVVETGTVQPLSKVDLKSKVGGRISELLVDEGTQVRQGQVLATIDPREINSEVDALRSQIAAARARLAAADKTAIYQQAQTDTGIDQYIQNMAAAKARLQLAETQARAQPTLTQQSIQIAQANLEAAEASLKAQQDSLALMVETTHPNAVVTAQSAYDEDKAQADNMQRDLIRQQHLLGKGYVSQQALDTADTNAAVAESHLREAREKLDRIRRANKIEEENVQSQIANARGQVNQMRAALAQARSDTLPLTRQDDLASARAAYAQAQAQLAAARSGRTQDQERQDEAVAAAADVQQIQNQLDEKLVTQRETTLIAPMHGIVTKRYVEKGDLITSGIDSFSSGTPVLQVADLQTMLVKIDINEVDINKLKRGMPTEVTIDASRDAIFMGSVSKVSPSANSDSSSSSGSSSGSNSQTVIRFPVEVRIDHADARLKPGMSAHCTVIVAGWHSVLRVPVDCTTGVGDHATVRVVTTRMQDGQPLQIVTPREVRVGLRGDNYVEILSGLREGEALRPNAYNGPVRKTIDMQN